jgi:hypothetical protein
MHLETLKQYFAHHCEYAVHARCSFFRKHRFDIAIKTALLDYHIRPNSPQGKNEVAPFDTTIIVIARRIRNFPSLIQCQF